MKNAIFESYGRYLCRKVATKWMCRHCVNKKCKKEKKDKSLVKYFAFLEAHGKDTH